MFVDTELLMSPLVFSSKKMTLPAPLSDDKDSTLLRCAFLAYNVNPEHWVSHCNTLHLLGRSILLQLSPFEMLIITLSISAEVFFISNLFKISFLLRQGVTM